VIDANVLVSLVSLLAPHVEPRLQYEAAWCFTNIALGSHQQVESIIAKDALPPLIALVKSGSPHVQEQVLREMRTVGSVGVEQHRGR
jgi:hypothetical protein